MKKIYLGFIFLITLSGCIQMPTTESKAIDNRPQVMFVSQNILDFDGYTVHVDGLDMGDIQSFTTGKQALRLLSGTHVIEIYKEGNLVTSKKIYLGEGVTKEVVVE
ncbi:hypothetical protein [Photobacterium sanguinicancri]|uniref:hypothetical protein n=1 Tax=Photobacterium sanguinicancri TaxID=875932 RepID=UPI0026E3954A|nr:hypothetical protein [Photobacterium sanguinicancri]MDO6498928.1 hypothetical protein [Photobacterium sanguinicancri]